MPLLKYSFYQKILNSSLTKCEQDKLIKTIYIISFSYLKNKCNKDTNYQIDENQIIESAIDVTVFLLNKKNNTVTELSSLIKNCKESILKEADFNYWVINLVIKRTEEFIETVLLEKQLYNKKNFEDI